jgi:hypothetical protein
VKIFNRGSDKGVLIQCPYATQGSADFCSVKHPYTLNMSSPDFQEFMEAHVQQHIQRDSSLFGLTLKRLACPICDFETPPFQSNNASQLKALGKEEMDAQIDLQDHIEGNRERVENLITLALETQDSDEKARLADEAEKYRGHRSCSLHETPGHEILTYYFRDKEEEELHVKLLHLPKIKPINPKLKRQ